MERLTFEGNFCDISQCHELPCQHDGNCSQKQVWERLKAYEDSRLSPQACAEAREAGMVLSSCDVSFSKLAEMLTAYKDGRVLILPCAEGTTVYRIRRPVATYPDKSDPEILQSVFTRYDLFKFGCTIFLTREEAERALQGMSGMAADYIRREDALKCAERDNNFCLVVPLASIERIPAADVAEVVRCKGCKYGSYDSKPDGAMVCLRTNDGFWRKETDFCSYGERREE